MKIAGIAYDIYDDSSAAILTSGLAKESQQLPEKLANMQMLEASVRDQLPDRLYGLVAVNNGETVRKYAMHDAPHLALSMIYFGETGRLLPTEAAIKVAQNLVGACEWYDIEPPSRLVKMALLGGVMTAATAGLGVMDMASKAKEGNQIGRERMDAFRQAQVSGTKQAGREVQLTLEQDAASQRGDGPEAGYISSILAQFSDGRRARHKLDSQMEQAKKAEIGRDVMPPGGVMAKGSPAVGTRAEPAKTSSLMLAGLMTGWQHAGDITEGPPTKKIAATYRNYALPHLQRYPIDTPEHVKSAMAYFNDHVTEFPLPERRAFAVAVSDRAEDLGIKMAGQICEYGGLGYGANIETELRLRIQQFENESKVAYEVLLEKVATLSPAVMADLLREADIDTGIADSYGRPGIGRMDPYEAVYGSKHAEEEEPFSWMQGKDYTNADKLMALANSQRDLGLDELFTTKGFTESFNKDPVGVFKSMPDPQKVILSRLASK